MVNRMGPSCLFMKTANVARFLSVSPRTIRLWAECGELPATKVGRQWRFEREAVVEWLRVNASGRFLDTPTTNGISAGPRGAESSRQ
jgi:excisionase family DNA binding protein